MENEIDRSDDSQRKSIDPELIINDIDLPLYTYGFFHRQDLNNYFDTESKRQKQKTKSFIITSWKFFDVVRYALHFIYLKNGRVPLYFFDVIQFLGGITEYFYGVAGFLSLLKLSPEQCNFHATQRNEIASKISCDTFYVINCMQPLSTTLRHRNHHRLQATHCTALDWA
jgi:hypothetical protein